MRQGKEGSAGYGNMVNIVCGVYSKGVLNLNAHFFAEEGSAKSLYPDLEQ